MTNNQTENLTKSVRLLKTWMLNPWLLTASGMILVLVVVVSLLSVWLKAYGNLENTTSLQIDGAALGSVELAA